MRGINLKVKMCTFKLIAFKIGLMYIEQNNFKTNYSKNKKFLFEKNNNRNPRTSNIYKFTSQTKKYLLKFNISTEQNKK